MARLLLVNAADLLRRPGTQRELDLELAPEELAIQDERLEPGAPIVVSLQLESLADGIVVEGRIGLRWRGECRRCLRALEGELDLEVQELYQRERSPTGRVPITGDQLDLEPMVRETVLLELPDGPLCRPDCAGLCPVCGTDRNVAPCTCDTAVVDERWAVLEQLRPELE